MVDHILWGTFVEAVKNGEGVDVDAVDGPQYMATCGGDSHCSACNSTAEKYLQENYPDLLEDIVVQTGRGPHSLIEDALADIYEQGLQ